jgi:hypothetical protein
MENRNNTQSYNEALFQAHSFLTQYGSGEELYAVSPTPIELEKSKTFEEALATASVLLNKALESSFKLRLKKLKVSKKKQRLINILHFITASAFVSLLGKESPDLIKWAGAIIALVAGIISLTLPDGIADIEKGVDEDTKKIGILTGKIAEAGITLKTQKTEIPESFFKELTVTIGDCAKLAKELELDRIKSEELNLW